jgi:hypothetical protein
MLVFVELDIKGLVFRIGYENIEYSWLDMRVGYPTLDVHSWTFLG